MTLCEQKLNRIETEYHEFVNALSHDFAGPFRHVIGFSDMIMRANEVSFDKKTSDRFNFIIEAGNSGKAMLDHLTAYARLTDDIEPPKPINISEMVRDILEELNDLILENSTEIDIGSLPEVTASPDLIRLSFFHIIKNAIMYSNNAPRPAIRITGVSTSTHVTYDIIDNGFGMTDHQINKVFLVLKRAVSSTDYRGNGMGLAVTKKAVQHHNGIVDIVSSPDTGTKVSISLPLV